MTPEESAIVKAAIKYVTAKRDVRGRVGPDPLPPKVEDEPSALDAFFIAEGVLFEAVDAYRNGDGKQKREAKDG